MMRERLEELVESVSNPFGDRHGTQTLDERIRAALLAVERETVERCAETVRQNAKEVAMQVRPYEPISAENVRLLMEDSRDACEALAYAIRSLLTEE